MNGQNATLRLIAVLLAVIAILLSVLVWKELTAKPPSLDLGCGGDFDPCHFDITTN